MSIGEKIAYYRKKAEMSQEELGNQLFVTRQTVSQWENDQTVPTVENFIRLCELFKLTMNDFFEQDVAEAKNTSAEAEERYVFEYNESDIDKVLLKLSIGPFCRSVVHLLGFAMLLWYSFYRSLPVTIISVFFCYLSIHLTKLIGSFIAYGRSRRQLKSRMMGQRYVYEVVNGGIYCSVYSASGELRLYERIDLTDIERTWNSPEQYIFQYKKRRYIIIKEQVPSDSKLKQLFGF